MLPSQRSNGVTEVTVYDRTQDAVVRYTGQRGAVIGALASFALRQGRGHGAGAGAHLPVL